MASLPSPRGQALLPEASRPLANRPLYPSSRRRAKRRYQLNWKKASLAAIAVYALISFISVGLKMSQANREVARLQAEHQALVQQRQELDRQIQKLNDPAYIEKLAREQLGLIKPGEKVVIFTEPGNPLPLKKDNRAVYKD